MKEIMMMNKKPKNPKTNSIAYIIGLLGVCAILLVATGKATLTEAATFLGAVGTLVAAIGFSVAKDSDNEIKP